MTIDIGNLSFGTKKAAEDYIREIIASHEVGQYISFELQSFCMALFQMHPNAQEKSGAGVSHFFVALDPDFGRAKCLYLMRRDGTTTDFSWKKCLGAKPDRRALVYRAMRQAIVEDILEFKKGRFQLEDLAPCAVTGKLLRFNEAHVDHKAPKTFIALANQFIAEHSCERAEVQSGDSNSSNHRLVDKNLELLWRDWHREHCELRIVSPEQNK
jgi:uncharacterized protein DUF3223